jgi:hypothetical protein
LSRRVRRSAKDAAQDVREAVEEGKEEIAASRQDNGARDWRLSPK